MKPTSTLTPPDSGRLCYRVAGERPDERPTLRIRRFWSSVEEEAAYLTAARNVQRIVDVDAETIENAVRYIGRIAACAESAILAAPAKRFPPAHRMNREYTGPREPVKQDGLTFEDRTDEIYDTEGGREG